MKSVLLLLQVCHHFRFLLPLGSKRKTSFPSLWMIWEMAYSGLWTCHLIWTCQRNCSYCGCTPISEVHLLVATHHRVIRTTEGSHQTASLRIQWSSLLSVPACSKWLSREGGHKRVGRTWSHEMCTTARYRCPLRSLLPLLRLRLAWPSLGCIRLQWGSTSIQQWQSAFT